MARWLAAVATMVLLASGVATAQTFEPPPSGVEPSEEVLAAIQELLPCPRIGQLEVSGGVGAVGSFSGFTRRCEWRGGGEQIRVTVSWQNPDSFSFFSCGAEGSFDAGPPTRTTINDPTHVISTSTDVNGPAAGRASRVEQVASELTESVRPFSRRCPTPPTTITCPAIEGLTAQEPRTPSSTSDRYEATCGYNTAEGQPAGRVELEWSPVGSVQGAQQCAFPDRVQGGFASLRASDAAAMARVVANDPGAMDGFIVGGRDLLAQLAPASRPCSEVDFVPYEEQVTPLPEFFASTFTAEAVTPAPGPEPVTTTTQPDETPSTTAAGGATTPPTTLGPSVAEQPGTAASGIGTLARILALVATVVSVAAVGLTLLTMRKETRLRPRFEILRAVVTAAGAIGFVVLLSRPTPLWAIGAAVVLGLALGWVQGSNSQLRMTEKGVMARRAGWAVVAFAAGVVLIQAASWLNRTGVIAVGVAISFLSAALAAGVIAGRRQQMASLSATTLLLPAAIVAGLAMLATPFAVAQHDGESHGCTVLSSEPPDRCPGHDTLIELVPWEEVGVTGGLFVLEGKPFADVVLPTGLYGDAPEPLIRTISWDTTNLDGIVTSRYSLDEEYTFAARDNGECCDVVYSGLGTRSFLNNSGEVTSTATHEMTGPLQPIGAIGEGVDAFTQTPGLPFTEIQRFGALPAEACTRIVGGPPARSSRVELTDLVYAVDGEAREPAEAESSGFAAFQKCEIPGFTIEAGLAVAPPPPPSVERRPTGFFGGAGEAGGCPVYQELVKALAPASFPGVDTATVGDLFLKPNSTACSAGSLFEPVAFGQGGPGGTRHELTLRMPDPTPELEAQRLAEAAHTFSTAALPEAIPPRNRCEIGTDGVPLERPDGERCETITIHETPDTGQIWIHTDYQRLDGPNVTVRAHLPWGNFIYRCHHCEPGDPLVVDFLDRLNDFGTIGIGNYGDGPVIIDEVGETGAPTTTTTPEQAVTEELGDLIDIVSEETGITDRDAIAAALVGILGAGALAGVSLLEGSLSATDLAQSFHEGGFDAMDERIEDAHRQAVEEVAVVDERGEVLMPGEDGLYEWDDGDSVRRVPREELEDLISRAEAAQGQFEAEHAALAAQHAARAEDDWTNYVEGFQDRMAAAQAAEQAQATLQQWEMDRGRRLRDVLEDHIGLDPVIDRMLDRLERDPRVSDSEFRTMRTILAQQLRDQALIDQLGDQSELAMALDGMRHDAAAVLDHFGPYGQVPAYVLRNPEILELPARIGMAWATGGASEIIMLPVDTWRTLERTADHVMATENRDLTTGEIVWEVAETAVWELTIAHLAGGGGGGSTVAADALQGMPPPRNVVLRHLGPGERIPPHFLHQTGFTQRHLDNMADFTRRRNVVMGARTTNPYSLRHLQEGLAIPKPLDIKSKSIGDLDVLLGAKSQHRGTVGLFEPRMPDTSGMTDELADAVRSRYSQRMDEWRTIRPQIEADPNRFIRDGRVFDAKTGKPFAGDMDMVYMRDATTGEIIRGQRYQDLVAEATDRGLIEHGAELNLVDDLTRGKPVGSPEWRAAWDKAHELRGTLEGATVHGNEFVVEMGIDGTLRMGPDKAQLMRDY